MTTSIQRRIRLAGVVWVGILVYPLIQALVALAWRSPTYSWRHDYISDLGNTVCGTFDGRNVCSPWHGLMNFGFVCTGVLTIVGCGILWQVYRTSQGMCAGIVLQACGGLGAILVGLFPENTHLGKVHAVGALLAFVVGNLSMVVLSLVAARRWPGALTAFTFLSGIIGLAGFLLFVSRTYLGLGVGGMERLTDTARVLWLITFGLVMVWRPATILLHSKHIKYT